jgi:hypothetical protein
MAMFNAISLMALNPGGQGMGNFMSFLAARQQAEAVA